MAEKFAFQAILRNGCAVQFDERLFLALACVHAGLVGHQLLAVCRFHLKTKTVESVGATFMIRPRSRAWPRLSPIISPERNGARRAAENGGDPVEDRGELFELVGWTILFWSWIDRGAEGRKGLHGLLHKLLDGP